MREAHEKLKINEYRPYSYSYIHLAYTMRHAHKTMLTPVYKIILCIQHADATMSWIVVLAVDSFDEKKKNCANTQL